MHAIEPLEMSKPRFRACFFSRDNSLACQMNLAWTLLDARGNEAWVFSPGFGCRKEVHMLAASYPPAATAQPPIRTTTL